MAPAPSRGAETGTASKQSPGCAAEAAKGPLPGRPHRTTPTARAGPGNSEASFLPAGLAKRAPVGKPCRAPRRSSIGQGCHSVFQGASRGGQIMSIVRRLTVPNFDENLRSMEMVERYWRFQEDEPIAKVRTVAGEQGWLVGRFEDVKALLGDQRLGRSHPHPDHVPRWTASLGGGPNMDFATEMAERTAIRQVLAAPFSPTRSGVAAIGRVDRDRAARRHYGRHKAGRLPFDLRGSVAQAGDLCAPGHPTRRGGGPARHLRRALRHPGISGPAEVRRYPQSEPAHSLWLRLHPLRRRDNCMVERGGGDRRARGTVHHAPIRLAEADPDRRLAMRRGGIGVDPIESLKTITRSPFDRPIRRPAARRHQ
jgi:hypothetical protein